MAVGPGGTFTYDIGEAKRGGGGYIGTGVDSLGRQTYRRTDQFKDLKEYRVPTGTVTYTTTTNQILITHNIGIKKQ